MGPRFAEIAFTPAVRELQSRHGSRRAYETLTASGDPAALLTAREAGFIRARDSFYMATVSETGWPYVQHRGGPPGFVHVLDPSRIGFADYRGNRQYVSAGNISADDRVSLIFMDYPNRARLKILGRASIIDASDQETLQALDMTDYPARVERGFIIRIEAFDWNCSQHITRRFAEGDIG